ncbi:MAG: type III-A CRISPR-associated protein Cas10/Csm1 [Geminicoccaceae bacterium]
MSEPHPELPTCDELALGAFLHDAGKLLQRALGTTQALPPEVRALESTLCPKARQGEFYTHKHVLFTELLFHDLEHDPATDHATLPGGLRRSFVRDAAVFHHHPRPERVWDLLVVEADQLASGMDRKAKDLALEGPDEQASWDRFRKTPLTSILSTVQLPGRAAPTPVVHRPRPADPETIVPEPPTPDLKERALPNDYAATGAAFRAAWKDLCRDRRQSAALLHEGVIGLAERFWWAVPSSTRDEPDVPLLDHALAVAAFAACLYRHHEARGELSDAAAIRDRTRPKFRLLRGDLSGIQSTLFRLASQQVKGVNRILRARSFLMGQLVEAAALLVRQRLGLPPYVVLMRAGGQFTLLLPELEGIEGKIAELQGEIDQWMATRYAGELALHLGLTEPLPPEAFLRARIGETLDRLRTATERAKQAPLRAFLSSNGPILKEDYEEGADGYCPACGVRPRKERFAAGGLRRCEACHHEYELGVRLPRLRQLLWLDGPGDEHALALFGKVRLRAVAAWEKPFEPRGNVVSAWRPWTETDLPWPVASRPIANHVPTFRDREWDDPRYRDIPEDIRDIDALQEGAIKSMAYLAAAAKDPKTERGRPMLAILKADVDNLGQIFGFGLGQNRSIGRLVALSRALDWFFTGHLPHLLKTRFPDTYTVYAGGDDLLLIGPWLSTVKLALELREAFRAYCGRNPSVGLSAGIALVSDREPLNRSADAAEDALEKAKHRPGKDALGFLGEVLDWADRERGLPWLLEKQDWLFDRLAEREAATAFAYKLLGFLEQRERAETKGETAAAIWRARYGYFLARTYPKPEERRIWQEFNALMGLDRKADPPPSKAAISMALWRNR